MLPLLTWLVLATVADSQQPPLRVLNFPSAETKAKQALLAKWSDELEAATGVGIEFLFTGDAGPAVALDRARASISRGEADALVIDVIDPGELEDYLETIEDAGVSPETISSILPDTLQVVERRDGKHTAIPFANNFAMLFYRKDLLAKYNFSEPTSSGWTYDEMEHIALVVQEGELERNAVFSGYVWQGAAYEGLTCHALEVIAAHDGGTILDKHGNVTVLKPGFRAGIERMLRWLYGDNGNPPISPIQDIVSYRETQTVGRFCRDRNAMFARGWTSMIGQCDAAGLAGTYGVVRNPGVERGEGHGTQGGGMLAVASTSQRKALAAQFIDMVMSYEHQLEWYNTFSRQSPRSDHAMNASLCSPTPQSCLVNAEKLLAKTALAFLPESEPQVLLMPPGAPGCNYSVEDQATICDVDKTNYIVSRPSLVARNHYGEVSEEFSHTLNDIFLDKDIDNHTLNLYCQLLETLERKDVPADHYCHDRIWAETCEEGLVWDRYVLACTPCDPGSAKRSGQLECHNCSAGTAASEAGVRTCSKCEPGSWAEGGGATTCKLCLPGTYSDSRSATMCLACPQGKTSARGSASVQECACPARTYTPSSMVGEVNDTAEQLLQGGSECRDCSLGLQCQGGTSPPIQEAGYWAEVQGTHVSVFKCRSTSECPEGPLGTCAANRDGIACSKCKDGHDAVAGGDCQPCSAWHGWPVLLMMVGAAMAGLALARLKLLSPGKVRLDMLAAASAAGQVFVAVQALGSISALSIDWESPTKGVLEFCSIFSLDTDIFNMSCVMQQNSPIVRSATILLAYPVLFGIIASVCLVCRRGKGHEVSTKDTLINLHGMMSCSLATVLSLRSADSFRCSVNPNGKFTMTAHPGVLCWESETHRTLVAFSVVGLLCYPIMALSWICSITFKYPVLVGSGRDAVVHHRHAFLFGRFRGRSFWFGLPYLARSLLIGLLPAVLAGEPSLQVMVVGTVFLVSAVLQVRVWPWKAWLANIGDMVSCSSLVVLLLGAGPLVKTETMNVQASLAEGSSIVDDLRWLGWVMVVPISSIFIVGGGTICYSLVVTKMHRKEDLFICHHKENVGALCRLIKLTIAQTHPEANVYLDIDTSLCFVEVLDLVRYRTRHFIAVVTHPLLTHPYCVGELATAMERNLPVLPLICDDLVLPCASWLEEIPDSWSTHERHTLFASGITTTSAKDALVRLRELTPLRLQRTAAEAKQVATFLELASYAGFSSPPVNKISCSVCSDPEVVIVADTGDPEALATAHVLKRLLPVELCQQVAVAHEPEQLQGESLEAVLVVFSRHVLESPTFRRLCRALVKTVDGGQRVFCATLLAEPGLEPPAPALCRALLLAEDAPLAWREEAPALCRLFQALGQHMAQPFTACAPLEVLKAQVAAVVRTHFHERPLESFAVEPLAEVTTQSVSLNL